MVHYKIDELKALSNVQDDRILYHIGLAALDTPKTQDATDTDKYARRLARLYVNLRITESRRISSWNSNEVEVFMRCASKLGLDVTSSKDAMRSLEARIDTYIKSHVGSGFFDSLKDIVVGKKNTPKKSKSEDDEDEPENEGIVEKIARIAKEAVAEKAADKARDAVRENLGLSKKSAKKKKASSDDEEEEAPKKSKKSASDDEEEEAPKKKASSKASPPAEGGLLGSIVNSLKFW